MEPMGKAPTLTLNLKTLNALKTLKSLETLKP